MWRWYSLFIIKDFVVGEAIVVIRRLVCMAPGSVLASHEPLVHYFMTNYNQITSPMAKASIIWLTGHNISHLEKLAPDTLRISLSNFCSETSIVKMFILNLALILYAHHQKNKNTLAEFSQGCFEYASKLAALDVDVDVRDFGRLISQLASRKGHNEGTFDLLLDVFQGSSPKSIPTVSCGDSFTLGSISFAMNQAVSGYVKLPDWTPVAKGASERLVKVGLG